MLVLGRRRSQIFPHLIIDRHNHINELRSEHVAHLGPRFLLRQLGAQLLQTPQNLYLSQQFDSVVLGIRLVLHDFARHYPARLQALGLRDAAIASLSQNLNHFIFLANLFSECFSRSILIFNVWIRITLFSLMVVGQVAIWRLLGLAITVATGLHPNVAIVSLLLLLYLLDRVAQRLLLVVQIGIESLLLTEVNQASEIL